MSTPPPLFDVGDDGWPDWDTVYVGRVQAEYLDGVRVRLGRLKDR